VTVSPTLTRGLSRDLWIRASRIVTVPNGASLTPASQSSLRDELQLGAGDRLAVAIGNLYPVKGHGYLLDALARLATRVPRLHVAIAGRGDLEAALRARARILHVDDRVHLLGLRSDVPNLLAGADVFVLPSLSEGLPLALLEAMMAGRPIIATAVGEVPAVLSNGRAGVLVPPGDAEALANALAGVLSDPALAHRLGGAAARRAAEEYTFEKMMGRYVALYARLLASGPASTRLQLADPLPPHLESREITHPKPTIEGKRRPHAVADERPTLRAP
jgi:glycosyltransferase involved in cell wall biosynthesis